VFNVLQNCTEISSLFARRYFTSTSSTHGYMSRFLDTRHFHDLLEIFHRFPVSFDRIAFEFVSWNETVNRQSLLPSVSTGSPSNVLAENRCTSKITGSPTNSKSISPNFVSASGFTTRPLSSLSSLKKGSRVQWNDKLTPLNSKSSIFNTYCKRSWSIKIV